MTRRGSGASGGRVSGAREWRSDRGATGKDKRWVDRVLVVEVGLVVWKSRCFSTKELVDSGGGERSRQAYWRKVPSQPDAPFTDTG